MNSIFIKRNLLVAVCYVKNNNNVETARRYKRYNMKSTSFDNYGDLIGRMVILGNEISKVNGQDPKDIINPVIISLPGVEPYKRNPINMGKWAK